MSEKSPIVLYHDRSPTLIRVLMQLLLWMEVSNLSLSWS